MTAPEGKKRRRIDWKPIKAAYIEGITSNSGERVFPSYEELSGKFEVHAVSIGRIAAKERWADSRKHLAAKIEDRRQEKKSIILANTMAAFDVVCLRATERMIQQITKRLDQAEDKVAPKPIDMTELRSIAQTLRTTQVIGRLALGDATENAALLANKPDRPDLSRLTVDELRTMERLTRMARGLPVDPVLMVERVVESGTLQ